MINAIRVLEAIIISKIAVYSAQQYIPNMYYDSIVYTMFKYLLPIGIILAIYKASSKTKELIIRIKKRSLAIKNVIASTIRIIIAKPVISVVFVLVNIIIGIINQITYIINQRSDIINQMKPALIVHAILLLLIMVFLVLMAMSILVTLPQFIATTIHKIGDMIYNIQKSSDKAYTEKQNAVKEKYNNVVDKLADKYINNIQKIGFTNKTTKQPYEYKNKQDNTEIILYNDANKTQISVSDYIFYGSNDEKADYFNKLDNYLEQKYSIKELEEILDSSMFRQINILDKIHTQLYDVNNSKFKEYVKNKTDFEEYSKVRNLKISMVNYINQRSIQIKSDRNSSNIGKIGEEKVNEYLKMYDDEIINLSGVRLEIEGNSIENDNILITRRGIFVAEVKNIGSTGSYGIEVEKNGRWNKVFTNGKREVVDFDASMQNERHIAYLKKLINRELNRNIDNYIDVKGIVIIANNKIDITNYSEQPIFRTAELYRYISKDDIIFTQSEMIQIKEIIEKSKQVAKRYPMIDYIKEIDYNLEYLNDKISNINLKSSEELIFTIEGFIEEEKRLTNEYNKKLHEVSI